MAIGFGRSRVVLVNEAHDGWRRCVRTREVGRRVLPVAFGAGARYLAMEALSEAVAHEANRTRRTPDPTDPGEPTGPGGSDGAAGTGTGGRPRSVGYLDQPDMRALVQDALDLGCTLVAYEAAWDELVAPGDDPMSPEVTNRREALQARNLARAVAALPPDARVLVWCGNGHLWKAPGSRWTPMACRFREQSGIDPFAIDQNRTVAFPSFPAARRRELEVLIERYAPELRDKGGTAGWLTEEAPPELRRSREDAFLLSVHYELE